MIKSHSSSLRAQTFLETVLKEFDASDPEEALQMLRRMKEQLSANVEQADDQAPSGSSSDPPSAPEATAVNTLERQLLALQEGDVELPTDEFATLLSFDVLRQLDERVSENLNVYDIGILAVDDDDRIQAANDYRPSLPGLEDDPVGASFFERLPASRNPLLQLPLQTAGQNKALDARFFYTFPRPKGDAPPLPVKLQFHRTTDDSVTWLLYTPL